MKEELKAFEKGLRRIDESGSNLIKCHGKNGLIVITANRSEIYSDNPDNDLTSEYAEWCKAEDRDVWDRRNMDFWLDKRNIQEDERLSSEIKSSKYSYSPVYEYMSEEVDGATDKLVPYYIVYCHAKEGGNVCVDFREFYEFGLALAAKYKQDRFYDSESKEAPITSFFESLYRKAGPSTYSERIRRRQLGEVFL